MRVCGLRCRKHACHRETQLEQYNERSRWKRRKLSCRLRWVFIVDCQGHEVWLLSFHAARTANQSLNRQVQVTYCTQHIARLFPYFQCTRLLTDTFDTNETCLALLVPSRKQSPSSALPTRLKVGLDLHALNAMTPLMHMLRCPFLCQTFDRSWFLPICPRFSMF